MFNIISFFITKILFFLNFVICFFFFGEMLKLKKKILKKLTIDIAMNVISDLQEDNKQMFEWMILRIL